MTHRKCASAVVLLACMLTGCAHAPVERASRVIPEKVDAQEASAILSAYRRADGRSGLVDDPTLNAAAARQATAMARADKLSHTIAGSLEQRLEAAHIDPAAADENVSAGYFTLSGAIKGWQKSPPHNANLLDPKMRKMGIGSAYAVDSKYHRYWSLILID